MTSLTVAICTYQRASVQNTILSIDSQEGRRADQILVIDNDVQPTAKDWIERIQPIIRTPIYYVHIPGPNIAEARNAALDLTQGGHLVFIDDDQVAPTRWLEKLTAAWRPGVAAIMGPSLAEYPEGAPRWMRHLAPHSQTMAYADKGQPGGHTGNSFIDLTHPLMRTRRFDARYGRTGGEDWAFFTDAIRDKASIKHVKDAYVFEPVPQERLGLFWLMKRRLRAGQIYARHADQHPIPLSMKAAVKCIYCVCFSVVNLFNREQRYRSLLRAALHVGTFLGCWGLKPTPTYGLPKFADAKLQH